MKHQIRAGHVAQLALFVGGIVLSGWAVACGSSSPPDDPPVTDFDGIYVADANASDGPDDVSVVGFVHGHEYVLATSSCYDASCAESGTYYYDENDKTITFTNGADGTKRVVPVEVLSAEQILPDGTLKPQTDDLVNNGVVMNCAPGATCNTNLVQGGTSGAPLADPKKQDQLVKRCPPGTTPADSSQGGTTTVPKDPPAVTPPKGDPNQVISISFDVSNDLKPLATPAAATDPCKLVKPTQIAKSAKLKTAAGSQKITKNSSRLSQDVGPGGGPGGSPGPGGMPGGMPGGGGMPNFGNLGGSPNSGFPFTPNQGTANAANNAAIQFCQNLANNSTVVRQQQRQIILMNCLSSSAI